MKKDFENKPEWEWLFSDREFEEGETFDLHWLLNKYTGEVKMIVTKRLEVVENNKLQIVRTK